MKKIAFLYAALAESCKEPLRIVLQGLAMIALYLALSIGAYHAFHLDNGIVAGIVGMGLFIVLGLLAGLASLITSLLERASKAENEPVSKPRATPAAEAEVESFEPENGVVIDFRSRARQLRTEN